MNFDHTSQTISNVTTLTPETTLTISSNAAIVMPTGTTSQQPVSPIAGMIRFDSSTAKMELYNGSWANVATESFVTSSMPSGNIILIGDAIATGVTGSNTSLTFNTVNSSPGIFGDANHVPQITVNGKGLVTLVSNVAIPNTVAIIGDATGTGTTSTNTTITLNTVNANIGQFTKVTVNGKGLVTSATSLSSTDVTAALGYTPISGTTVGAGTVLQTIVANIPAVSGTTTISATNSTNSLPTITDGTQIIAMSITPAKITSRVNFSGTFLCDNSNSNRYMWAFFFRGSRCIGVSSVVIPTHGQPMPIAFTFVDSPATTSSITYSIRVAGQGNAWYINQSSIGSYWGGAMTLNTIALQELS